MSGVSADVTFADALIGTLICRAIEVDEVNTSRTPWTALLGGSSMVRESRPSEALMLICDVQVSLRWRWMPVSLLVSCWAQP